MKTQRKSFVIVLVLVVIIGVCKFRNYQERSRREQPYPIAWDVYGYYLYLPATFIYHDPGLEKREWLEETRKVYAPSPFPYQYTKGKEKRRVIIYNIGYSFLFAPGFFVAHSLAPVLGYPADGFSVPYQYALEITALIFTLIGIFLFRKICLRFFSDTITALVLLFTLLGTNYFYQVSYDAVMPHNLLFTLNCLIIWFTIRWHDEYRWKHLLLLALTLGLASICRPTELIWILLPVGWTVADKKSFSNKLHLLLLKWKQLLVFGLVLFLILMIQLGYLKYATGYFRAFNLHSESFSFLDPYTLKFLFSYRKGWLLYTPVMIFCLPGFYFLYKQRRDIWLPLTCFFLINVYVLSSWECWWYAASFGQRPMVESYAMMLFPMGAFFNWLWIKKPWLKIVFGFFLSFFLVLNLFQTWQFVNSLLDPERMTKAFYWRSFGATSINGEDRKLLSLDRATAVFPEGNPAEKSYRNKLIYCNSFEDLLENSVDSTAASGKKSYLLPGGGHNSPTFRGTFSELSSSSYAWVVASVKIKTLTNTTVSNAQLVLTMESRGREISYQTVEFDSLNLVPNEWKNVRLIMLTPEMRHKEDAIVSFVSNSGTQALLLDDFKIELVEPKEKNN